MKGAEREKVTRRKETKERQSLDDRKVESLDERSGGIHARKGKEGFAL